MLFCEFFFFFFSPLMYAAACLCFFLFTSFFLFFFAPPLTFFDKTFFSFTIKFLIILQYFYNFCKKIFWCYCISMVNNRWKRVIQWIFFNNFMVLQFFSWSNKPSFLCRQFRCKKKFYYTLKSLSYRIFVKFTCISLWILYLICIWTCINCIFFEFMGKLFEFSQKIIKICQFSFLLLIILVHKHTPLQGCIFVDWQARKIPEILYSVVF